MEDTLVTLTMDESELFAHVCDAIMRGHCANIADDDPYMHTSDVARRVAARFMRQVGVW